jgi:hypothetical protein
MSTLKVESLRHYDADSDALTLSSSGTITFNGTLVGATDSAQVQAQFDSAFPSAFDTRLSSTTTIAGIKTFSDSANFDDLVKIRVGNGEVNLNGGASPGDNFANRVAPLTIGFIPGVSPASADSSALLFDGNQIEQAMGTNSIYLNFNSPANVRMVEGGGNVGINTASPSGLLDVAVGSASAPTYVGDIRVKGGSATAKGGIEIRNTTYSSGYGWRIDGPDEGGGSTPLVFRSRSNSADWTERVRFLAGGGIAFNGDTAAANALDDYEEGTFTATLRGSTSEPATLISDTSNYYTKIGNMVKVRISIENVDTTGYAGEVSFNGLPFTSANNTRTIGTLLGYRSMVSTPSNPTGIVSMVFPNSTNIATRAGVSDAPWTTPTHSAGTGRYFFIDMVYMVS